MKKLRLLIIPGVLIPLLLLAWWLFGGRLSDAYYHAESQRAIQDGQPLRAADLLSKRLAATPTDRELRLQICDLYIQGGNVSRAEYLLQNGLTELGPSAELYRKLSHVFVLQDKLYDAVDLLDSINSPTAGPVIQEVRPDGPLLSPAPGDYTELQTLTIEPRTGVRFYLSLTGDIPSTGTDLYQEPVPLEPGVTKVMAVAVDEEGLVSSWLRAEYDLRDIVMPYECVDPAVESLLRTVLNKPEGYLYTDDLWSIEEINVPQPAAYTTLADLAACTQLKKLTLAGNQTRCDISALAGLTGLESLSLQGMAISAADLTALSGLTGLRTLDLSRNSIGDVSALQTLTRLSELNLSTNSLLDTEPLAALKSLRKLTLAQNALSDAAPLGQLTALEELDISENRFAAVNDLAGLPVLQTLHLQSNMLITLEPLLGCPLLREVFAGGNGLLEDPDDLFADSSIKVYR